MTLRFFYSFVSMAIGLVTCSALAADVPRIMPLGDSITAGWSQPSYRLPLARLLESRDCNVDFVGNQALTSHKADDPGRFPGLHFPSFSSESHPGYATDEHWDPGLGDDTDHAGYNGVNVMGLLNLTMGEIRSAQPDFVLLHIGTNDVLKAFDVHTEDDYARFSIARVREINQVVKSIFAGHDDPKNLKVLLANMIPSDPRDQQETEMDEFQISKTLTRYIEALIEGRADPRLIKVDVATGFEPHSMTGDGIHPNAKGEKHIAEAFLKVLLEAGLCE